MKASETKILCLIIFMDILILDFCHANIANDHNLRHHHHNVHGLMGITDLDASDLSDKKKITRHRQPILKITSRVYLENIPGKILKNKTNAVLDVVNKTSNPIENIKSGSSAHRVEWRTYIGKDEMELFEDRSASGLYNDFHLRDVLQKTKVLANEGRLSSNFDYYENENYVSEGTPMEVYGSNLAKRRSSYFEPKDAFATPYIPGSLTKHKYETLGTHDAVQLSRKSHITNHHLKRDMAKKHARKIDSEARCKWPKPKIEKIQKETSKIYVPHCTVLHRCSDDTGCCVSEHQTCVAKHFENVSLYFFVKSLGSTHGTVEIHTFINHTECECVDRIHSGGLTYSQQNILKHAMKLDCVCPRLFETVLQGDGCRCDCSSGNSGCDSLKRGMEHFSLADRKCINEGRCKIPTCEYGFYIRKVGQCPRKENKMTFSRSFH